MMGGIFNILGLVVIFVLLIRQYWLKRQLDKQIESNRQLLKDLDKANWKEKLQETINEANSNISNNPKSATDGMYENGWINTRRNE